jgi:hypothetical protein
MYICSDQSRGVRKTLYVSQIRGHGGKDWGYTDSPGKALPLSERLAKIYINELGSNGGRAMDKSHG